MGTNHSRRFFMGSKNALGKSLLASASQVRPGETGTEKHHGGRLGHSCLLRSNRKDNAVVPEMTIRIEAEREVVAV